MNNTIIINKNNYTTDTQHEDIYNKLVIVTSVV